MKLIQNNVKKFFKNLKKLKIWQNFENIWRNLKKFFTNFFLFDQILKKL